MATEPVNREVGFDPGVWLQSPSMYSFKSVPTSSSSAVEWDHRKRKGKKDDTRIYLLHTGKFALYRLGAHRSFLYHKIPFRPRLLSHFPDEKTEAKEG